MLLANDSGMQSMPYELAWRDAEGDERKDVGHGVSDRRDVAG